MTTDFKGFPKIARLSRECVITEKIDGTNASIYIGDDGEFLVGSRTRWITPTDDNYRFAKWAYGKKDELMPLGPGHHFGEWWGQGIQRKYEVKEKRFSLFNTVRWCLHGAEPQPLGPNTDRRQDILPVCCYLVPVLYRGPFSDQAVNDALQKLVKEGSAASPCFRKPEGIVVYHIAANVAFKKTIEKDEECKGKGVV